MQINRYSIQKLSDISYYQFSSEPGSELEFQSKNCVIKVSRMQDLSLKIVKLKKSSEQKDSWPVYLRAFKDIVHYYVGNSAIRTQSVPETNILFSFTIKLSSGQIAYSKDALYLRNIHDEDTLQPLLLPLDSLFKV